MTIYINWICCCCIDNEFRISSNSINLTDVYTVDTLVIGDMQESYCIPICGYILYESQIQSNDFFKIKFAVMLNTKFIYLIYTQQWYQLSKNQSKKYFCDFFVMIWKIIETKSFPWISQNQFESKFPTK